MKDYTSIIIPIHNEGANIYNTIENIKKNTFDRNYEIIVIDDGSTDGNYSNLSKLGVKFIKTRRNGVSRARNLGAKMAKGNFLVFLDSHMSLSPDWLPKLTDKVEEFGECLVTPVIYNKNKPERKGYGLTIKSWLLDTEWLQKKNDSSYEIPIAGLACVATTKKFFNQIGGFDSGMKMWGAEQEEICIRSWLYGFPVMIEPRVEIGHFFRDVFPYKIDKAAVLKNIFRLAYSHFDKEKIDKVLSAWKSHPDFQKAYFMNLFSDVLIRRHMLLKKRKFNDDWFFEKFNINLNQ